MFAEREVLPLLTSIKGESLTCYRLARELQCQRLAGGRRDRLSQTAPCTYRHAVRLDKNV